MTNLNELIEKGDVHAIASFMKANNLVLGDNSNRIVARDEEVRDNCDKEYKFYDQRQLIRKILLNS